jgi:hypothetical protein
MSKLLSTDYNNVLDLIEAIYATPRLANIPFSGCGYPLETVISSLRTQFPDNTMTDDQVADTLLRGVRSGVFKRSCSTATTESYCNTSCAGELIYTVNSNMVRANPANKVFAAVFNPPVPKQNFNKNCFGVNDPIDPTVGAFYGAFTTTGGGVGNGTTC